MSIQPSSDLKQSATSPPSYATVDQSSPIASLINGSESDSDHTDHTDNTVIASTTTTATITKSTSVREEALSEPTTIPPNILAAGFDVAQVLNLGRVLGSQDNQLKTHEKRLDGVDGRLLGIDKHLSDQDIATERHFGQLERSLAITSTAVADMGSKIDKMVSNSETSVHNSDITRRYVENEIAKASGSYNWTKLVVPLLGTLFFATIAFIIRNVYKDQNPASVVVASGIAALLLILIIMVIMINRSASEKASSLNKV